MKDTIDLLQAIGQDASLRHASGEDLARMLAGMHASEGLRQAVLSGRVEPLAREFGPLDNKVTHSPVQSPSAPGFEDEADDVVEPLEEEQGK